jgi:hypothetical protein
MADGDRVGGCKGGRGNKCGDKIIKVNVRGIFINKDKAWIRVG